MGPRTEEPDPTQGPEASAEGQPEDNRPTVDPAVQPQRPEISRPEEPAALTEQSAEGAQATLTYMLESYTYMMTTGDTSVWSESVDPDCQVRSEEHTSELQSRGHLVCRLLLEKKNEV